MIAVPNIYDIWPETDENRAYLDDSTREAAKLFAATGFTWSSDSVDDIDIMYKLIHLSHYALKSLAQDVAKPYARVNSGRLYAEARRIQETSAVITFGVEYSL